MASEIMMHGKWAYCSLRKKSIILLKEQDGSKSSNGSKILKNTWAIRVQHTNNANTLPSAAELSGACGIL